MDIKDGRLDKKAMLEAIKALNKCINKGISELALLMKKYEKQ